MSRNYAWSQARHDRFRGPSFGLARSLSWHCTPLHLGPPSASAAISDKAGRCDAMTTTGCHLRSHLPTLHPKRVSADTWSFRIPAAIFIRDNTVSRCIGPASPRASKWLAFSAIVDIFSCRASPRGAETLKAEAGWNHE